MSEELEPSIYTDGNEYESRRFPNMSGGQKDAAAAPDERDEKKNIDEPRSEVAIRNKNSALKQALHGDHPPTSHLPTLINILNTQIEQLKTLKNIQDVLEYQIPLGQSHAFTIPYKTGAVFTHIDFADETQTFGVPSGVIVNEPNRKLNQIEIFNDGPGSIKFSTNLPRSDGNAEIQLNAGESYKISFLYSVIWSINISVTAGAPSVRIIYLV